MEAELPASATSLCVDHFGLPKVFSLPRNDEIRKLGIDYSRNPSLEDQSRSLMLGHLSTHARDGTHTILD